MILIRVFKTRREASFALEILEKGGIKAKVSEDKFYGIPIQAYGVEARFRLLVEDKDFRKTTKYLAGKLKNKS